MPIDDLLATTPGTVDDTSDRIPSVEAESPNKRASRPFPFAGNAVKHHALCFKFVMAGIHRQARNAQEESEESKSH